MDRILVIGSPGAGKTTFSLALAARLSLPVVHLDRLFWRDGWQSVSREEFDRQLAEAMDAPAWIIDGNYSRTLPVRLAAADTVIWLRYPTVTCLTGVLCRVIRNRGKSRPDMGGNCPERLDGEFLRYVCGFRKTQQPKMQALLAKAQDKRIVVLKSRRAAEKFLKTLP